MRWAPGKAAPSQGCIKRRQARWRPSRFYKNSHLHSTPWCTSWRSVRRSTLSWDNFSLLPWPLHGAELDLTGHVFQETLACPTVQVVQLKPSLLLRSRNVPVSPQIWVTIQEEPGPALPELTLLFLQTLRVLLTSSLVGGKRAKARFSNLKTKPKKKKKRDNCEYQL